MTRPTVVELNFPEFRRALEQATANGSRILPRETARWRTYVDTHKVRETNFKAYARGKYENLEPVIIDAGPPWGGYYMWSAMEEVVMRWQRAEAAPDPAAAG